MSTYFIIENSNSAHEEGISTLSRVLKSKKHRVVLCLNSSSLGRVSSLSFSDYIDEIIAVNTVKGFLRLIKELRLNGIALHNTVSVRNTLTTVLFSIAAKKNIYYIRNANSWIFYSKHKGSFFNKLLRYSSTFIKKILLKKSNLLIVESDQIQGYLERNIFKKVEVIPYKFYSENLRTEKKSDFIDFVIPGAVDLERKPLQVIFKALSSLSLSQLNRVRVVLLGRPLSDSDREFCLSLKDRFKSSVVVFEEFIPTDVFHDYMKRSSYVIGSIQIDHEDIYLKEVYGTTKGSGVFGQAIGYSKPLIINTGFLVPSQLKMSTLYYKDEEELKEIFKTTISDNGFNERIQAEAENSSKQFTIDRISASVDLI